MRGFPPRAASPPGCFSRTRASFPSTLRPGPEPRSSRAAAWRTSNMASAPAFPGYRVLGTLGEGGMGQVYLAEDEMLGRKVAIKTILPSVAGKGESRARFLREARAMATVEHPHVVRVYSFGETAGQAYFVMECVEGET